VDTTGSQPGRWRTQGHRRPAEHSRRRQRERNQGPVGLAVGAVVVALIGLAAVACSQSTPHAAGPSGASRSAHAARPAAAAPAFCQAGQANAASVLGRLVPDSGQSELVPLGASANGRVAYVSAWTPDFAGVAALDLASGRLRPIQRFGNPASDQADGVSAGRWLVWAETYSLESLDTFTMYAFDAANGRVRPIGHSLAGPDGTAWPSPWHAPAVNGNYAAWAQGYAPGGLVEIRLADLVTGKVTTIARGHVQPPFFDGDLVVWPESDVPGSQTRLRAYSLTAHAAAPLPPVLAAVHGTDFVVSDGSRTAYLSPDFSQLYYSPAEDVVARPVVQLPAGTDFTDLALAPGALAWTTSQATYLASTRTGAFVQVTPEYGYATGSSSIMLITDAPSQKAEHPALPTYIVNPATFAWPACSG
jgi:hypothetical protein